MNRRCAFWLVTVSLATFVSMGSIGAMQTVTPSDIDRLRDAIFEANTDVAGLRTGDAGLTRELHSELSDLSDETTYLRVKLRKGEPVSPADVASVRERIEAVRRRAHGSDTVKASGGGPSAVAPEPGQVIERGVTVPAGTRLSVRLLSGMDGSTLRVGDRIESAVAAGLTVHRRLVIPVGTLVRGVVTGVSPIRVTFDYLTINYHAYQVKVSLASPLGHARHSPGDLLKLRFDEPALIADH
jgi:hypothetical protein